MSGLLRNEFPHMPGTSCKDAIRKQLSRSQEKSPHPNPPCWNPNTRLWAYKYIVSGNLKMAVRDTDSESLFSWPILTGTPQREELPQTVHNQHNIDEGPCQGLQASAAGIAISFLPLSLGALLFSSSLTPLNFPSIFPIKMPSLPLSSSQRGFVPCKQRHLHYFGVFIGNWNPPSKRCRIAEISDKRIGAGLWFWNHHFVVVGERSRLETQQGLVRRLL